MVIAIATCLAMGKGILQGPTPCSETQLTMGIPDLAAGWFWDVFETSGQVKETSKMSVTPDGTRTHNPWLRRPVPYPLGHWGLRQRGHVFPFFFFESRSEATH